MNWISFTFVLIFHRMFIIFVTSEQAALKNLFSVFVRRKLGAHSLILAICFHGQNIYFLTGLFPVLLKSLSTCIYVVSDMEEVWVVLIISFHLKETNELEQ